MWMRMAHCVVDCNSDSDLGGGREGGKMGKLKPPMSEIIFTPFS